MFAKSNGIDVTSFNKHKIVSGRDILHRIRCSKKRVMKRITIPTPRSSKKIRSSSTKNIWRNISSRHKNCTKNSNYQHFGYGWQLNWKTDRSTWQKNQPTKNNFIWIIPIASSRSSSSWRHALRHPFWRTGQISFNDYRRKYNSTVQWNEMKKLKKFERTSRLKMWHDHSDILNHTYINFMTNILYDHTNIMTDEEYQTSKKVGKKHQCPINSWKASTVHIWTIRYTIWLIKYIFYNTCINII